MNPSTRAVSPLRQSMLDDMRMRKLEPKTQSARVRAARSHPWRWPTSSASTGQHGASSSAAI